MRRVQAGNFVEQDGDIALPLGVGLLEGGEPAGYLESFGKGAAGVVRPASRRVQGAKLFERDGDMVKRPYFTDPGPLVVDAMDNGNSRLMTVLRTDVQGRYAYRTIPPGSYPGTRVPQHIHYEVTADGHGTRILEIVFEDDPFLCRQIRADAAGPW